MFQLTPLLGAKVDSSASQSLLELDGGIKILVDLGWDERFSVDDLDAIARHTKSLSFILLTHATTDHLAAFAHCCKHIPLFTQVPIYATLPVISLGKTLLQDLYSSNPLASTVIPQRDINQTSFSYLNSKSDDELHLLLQPPSSTEIDTYFSRIHPLKYSQPHQPLSSPFSPPLNDLTITAYNAGHSLGGTIWHLQHGMESIVYAVDWNQTKENVYAGAAWLRGTGGTEVIEQLRKPTALVCSAKGAEKVAVAGGSAKRDLLLVETIRSRIATGATVLIPTDSSARALELAYVLEHAWRKGDLDVAGKASLRSAKLFMASKTFDATMQYAGSMLEWMEDNIVREFETEASTNNRPQNKRGTKQDSKRLTSQPNVTGAGPFAFRYLKKIQSRRRLEKVLSDAGPKVILASDNCLEWGYAKTVLERIAPDENNLVVLTNDNSVPSSAIDAETRLVQRLWKYFRAKDAIKTSEVLPDGSMFDVVKSNGRKLEFNDIQCSALNAKELSIYQQYLANQQQAESFSQLDNRNALETSADAVDDESSSSSSEDEDSDPERQGRALNSTYKAARFHKAKSEPSKEALGVNVLLRHHGVYDYDVRDKRGRDQIFPMHQRRTRADEFGEVIKPEDYLRAEERDETDSQDLRDDSKSVRHGLGQKRKWQESQQDMEDHRSQPPPNKRRQQRKVNGIMPSADGEGPPEMNGHDANTESSDDSDSEIAGAPNGPTRLEAKSHSVDARLSITYIDFAGIHDQRSLSMLIPLIQPKKLALIGGNSRETCVLADACKPKVRHETDANPQGDLHPVFTPGIGQTIDMSVDTNAWTVKLSDALSRQLHWQNVKGRGVVTLAGHLARVLLDPGTETETDSRKKLKVTKEQSEAKTVTSDQVEAYPKSDPPPTLDILPANVVAAPSSMAQPLHVGDLRLADLRKLLLTSGHAAEFRGEGTLLIDGLVAVRKSTTGKIELESVQPSSSGSRLPWADSAFYSVKRTIYNGLAVIAGG